MFMCSDSRKLSFISKQTPSLTVGYCTSLLVQSKMINENIMQLPRATPSLPVGEAAVRVLSVILPSEVHRRFVN